MRLNFALILLVLNANLMSGSLPEWKKAEKEKDKDLLLSLTEVMRSDKLTPLSLGMQ